MNAFDKVIGYKATKRELLQLCDMLRNREIYEEMGARLPHGLLLYGDPGLGKTLLARCFVEESGLHTITVRRDKGGDAFIDGITQAFASAKTKAPSIVLLDDMDKFANEDDTHCDAPEYAAVQAGIDDVKDTGVFVIATANDIRKLPSSLRRSGRFDRKIGLRAPTASDAEEIIAHYGRGETYSLELGNNLSRALTSELAMLATPETIPLFLRKYQQKQVKQYRRREPVYKGMGDIICCLDESNSTKGETAAWGKAVAMTLLEIAAESRRSFALIHFAGSSSCQVDIFRPGEYTLEDKLTAAETFLGGGTNFERPIREAIHLMESEGFEKADVVFITDGECALSDACQQELQASQVVYHFTVTGILLDKGRAGMGFSLEPFCQKIYRTSELTGDGIIQSVISLRV